MPDLVICIVNYRTPDLTLHCLASVAEERDLVPDLKVVVADGCSGDSSAEKLAAALADERFRGWAEFLPLPLNGGFGWANNQIMLTHLQSPSPPSFFYLLNPDTIVRRGAIKALRDRMVADPRCAAVGSQLVDGSDNLQASAFHDFGIRNELARGAQTHLLVRLLGARHVVMPPAQHPHRAEWVSGASVMLRSAALREAGLFDDSFFLYFEETELLWRLRREGWAVWYEPASKVEHEGGASTKLSNDARKLAQAGRPFYWYQSQRRLMFRTMSPLAAWAAFGAWMIGRLLFILRLATRTSRQRPVIRRETRDTLRAWLHPSKVDREPHLVCWNSPVGAPPAWMQST